ncbi:MAG: hypothetical protein LBB98_01210 [Treponema sp.]|nr:hypothetical protein [Treponema sp.]
MLTTIAITCPHCHSPHITRNGKKSNGTQNYRCTACGRPFISIHEITYHGCHPWLVNLVTSMLVRGMGIRDISTILKISITKVLTVLISTKYQIKPKKFIMIVLK